MTRQRLRAIQRCNDQIVSDPRPRTTQEWLHEAREVGELLNEIGVILLLRLGAKSTRSSAEHALYHYVTGTPTR